MRKNNKARKIMLPHFKLYYKTLALILKSVWYWHGNGHIDQGNRIKRLEINLSIDSLLIHGKIALNIQWAKNSVFN